jgi:hypothetical protein
MINNLVTNKNTMMVIIKNKFLNLMNLMLYIKDLVLVKLILIKLKIQTQDININCSMKRIQKINQTTGMIIV